MSSMLMSMGDIAHECRVHPSRVSQWVKEGKFPEPITLGPRTLRWRREDVVQWIASWAKAQNEAN